MNLPLELIEIIRDRYFYTIVAQHSDTFIQDLPPKILQTLRECDLYGLVKYKEYKTFSTGTLVSSSLNWALRWGLLDVCEWIVGNTEYTFDCDSFLNHPQVLAAAGGHLDVMKWLIVQHGIHPIPESFDTAASNGHLHILKWLKDNGYTGASLKTLWYAKNLHYDEIVKWLESNYNL